MISLKQCPLTIFHRVILMFKLSFCSSGSLLGEDWWYFQFTVVSGIWHNWNLEPYQEVIPYICVNIWHLLFSFWLTSLCITSSRSIHFISTDSICSFVWLSNIPLHICCSVSQLCPTLFNPMNCSISGLPIHHQLPEFTQIHIHSVGDAIQPSHPLLFPSPPAPNT